jgi:hypothetical protein
VPLPPLAAKRHRKGGYVDSPTGEMSDRSSVAHEAPAIRDRSPHRHRTEAPSRRQARSTRERGSRSTGIARRRSPRAALRRSRDTSYRHPTNRNSSNRTPSAQKKPNTRRLPTTDPIASRGKERLAAAASPVDDERTPAAVLRNTSHDYLAPVRVGDEAPWTVRGARERRVRALRCARRPAASSEAGARSAVGAAHAAPIRGARIGHCIGSGVRWWQCFGARQRTAHARANVGTATRQRSRAGLIQSRAILSFRSCVQTAVLAGVGRTNDGAARHLAALALRVRPFPVASWRRSRTVDGAVAGLTAGRPGQTSGKHQGCDGQPTDSPVHGDAVYNPEPLGRTRCWRSAHAAEGPQSRCANAADERRCDASHPRKAAKGRRT